MLTPNDVHYLVGLLMFIADEDNIEIELGSWVWDVASEEDRDVDITITTKSKDGTVSVFKGIEVKKEKRKLDVKSVEGLCRKLADMPSITQRAIVSASGFTKGAIRKAKFHRVELIELVPWVDSHSSAVFGVAFDRDLDVSERIFSWYRTLPTHQLIFQEPLPAALAGAVPLDAKIYDSSGKPYLLADLSALLSVLHDNTLTRFVKDEASNALASGEKRVASVYVNIRDNVYIDLKGYKAFLVKVHLSGEITCMENKLPPEFKILRKYGEAEPYIGCAIADSKMGLVAISLSKDSGRSRTGVIYVPVSDRLKNKIYRQKMRRNSV